MLPYIHQVPHTASDDTFPSSVSLPNSWRHLISLNIATINDPDEAVTHLAFGGGPHVLLAAATRTKLAIFSLEPLMDHVFQADTAASVAYEHESSPWELSSAVHDETYFVGSIDCFCGLNNNSSSRGPVEILSISWTHQLDGILVSDTAGDLAMWQLTPIESRFNSFGNGLKDLAVMSPSSATCARLRCAWKTTAPEPQDLLSAGVSVEAPSASAASVGEKNANLWWPENSPSNSASRVSVRREKLKHSCNIVSLEWCPGVLRKDVFATDINGAGASGAGGDANTTSSTTSPDKMNTNTSSNSTIPPIEDHPALMTLGTDKAVRLWVEMLVVHHAPVVQSHNNEDKEQQAPAPTLDSYFAMALVVDAPAAGTSSNFSISNTPEKGGGGSGGSGGGVHSKPGGFEKSTGVGILPRNSSMIARWVRGNGSMMGRQRRGTTSGEVLWVVIATKQTEKKERSKDNKNDARITENAINSISNSTKSIDTCSTSHWLVKLYAVRGLSAVVVANIPGSVAGVSSLTGSASGGGKKPQAVLWGQHIWSGATNTQNLNMSNTQSTSSVLSSFSPLSSFSAWMSAEDDFPVVTCFDITACTAAAHLSSPHPQLQRQPNRHMVDIAAAGVTYATVLAESPTSPSTLHQRLDAVASWKASTAGSCGSITAMAVCPSTSNSALESTLSGNNNSSTSGNAFNNALGSKGGDAARDGETTQRVATLNEKGDIALWDAKDGILEYLESYSCSESIRLPPKCLQWVPLPKAFTRPLSPNPSSVASPSTAVTVGSPSHVLLVGAGRDLVAMHPSDPSISAAAAANSEFSVLEEVEYNILSLHVFTCSGSNDVLLVLQTRDASSTENATFESPAYATLFEIQSKTSSAATSTAEQQQQKIMLHRLGSLAFGGPHSFSGAVTAVTPLPFSLATLNENSRLSLLVGTGTGHVHTAVLPFTDSGTMDKEIDVSKPLNLASCTSSINSPSLAVVALAVDDYSGTAAAVLVNNSSSSTGLASRKSYLALWKLQQPASRTTSTASTASSTTSSTTAASSAGATPILIPLENPGCSVSWVRGLIVPCVAVGDVCGNITFYAPVRDATEGWKAVAQVESAITDGSRDSGEEKAATMATAVGCLHGGGGGGGGSPVVAAVGSRIVCVSDDVVVDHEVKPLSRYVKYFM